MVVVFGTAVVLPESGNCWLSSPGVAGEMVTDVAFVVCHASVVNAPATTLVGVAVNVVIVGFTGAATVIVTVAVAVPPEPVAVAVYVVFVVGDTVVVPVAANVPDTPVMVTAVAFVELHESVTDWPVVMLALSAVIWMVGAGAVFPPPGELAAPPQAVNAPRLRRIKMPRRKCLDRTKYTAMSPERLIR